MDSTWILKTNRPDSWQTWNHVGRGGGPHFMATLVKMKSWVVRKSEGHSFADLGGIAKGLVSLQWSIFFHFHAVFRNNLPNYRLPLVDRMPESASGRCLVLGGVCQLLGGCLVLRGVWSWGVAAPGGCLVLGVSAPGGVSCLGGVSAPEVCLVWGGVSAPRGCLVLGGLLPGGCLVLGVASASGGCLLPGGCLVLGVMSAPGVSGLGGVCSGGVSAPGGCLLWGWYPSMHWGRHPPCEQDHTHL